MIYVISKSTFGEYGVRDIQCNANWCSCPYSDYALIPDSMVEGILATQGYCDITLNSDGTEVMSFTARAIPSVPEECHGVNTVLSVNGVTADTEGKVTLTPNAIGAAPSGYGYGDIPVNLGSTTDDAAFLVKLNEQFAKTVSRTRLVVFTRNGNAWLGELYNAGNSYGALTAYCYGGDNSSQFSKLVRNCKNGVWSDWEFENPPLRDNTEYLTTERIGNKPVYVKRVDLGALPNKSNKREVIIPTGSTIVGIDGYSVYTSSAGNEIYTPLVKTEGVTSFFVNKTTGQVGINTDTDLSTYTATVTVKYTK